MKSKTIAILCLVTLSAAAAIIVRPDRGFAHCDGLDGPVVKAAQQALDSGNVNPVLIWVQKSDEAEIRDVFKKTLVVRKLNTQARELADRYFFETLVRLHRAGEGAPYTGLKPAGRDLGPAIPAADRALENGNIDPLLKLLTGGMQAGVQEQFKQVMAKKDFQKEDVSAGREYVRRYVEFVHYVERIHDALKSPAEGHYPEHEAPSQK